MPRKSTSDEKNYCVRNYFTCCSQKDFDLMKTTFDKQKTVFKKKIDLLEELLSLFIGDNHAQFLRIAMLTPQCSDLIKKERVDIPKEKKPKDLNDFLDNFLQDEIDQLYTHLSDLEIYVKKNKFLQGDFVCGICNPLN